MKPELTAAVMQPYFYPYIGYYHLVSAVDTFVVFDDVNFIKKGWINRNNILLNGEAHLFTLSIKDLSQNKKINESFIFEPVTTKTKVLNLIRNAYAKAPFFEETFETLKTLILNPEDNIALYNMENLRGLSNYLGLKAKFVLSSEIKHNYEEKGQNKILSILKSLGASTYVNAVGGKELYVADDFKKNDIDLFFVNSGQVKYQQYGENFLSHLSIIDVLMFNGKKHTQELLQNYKLTS